MHAFWHHLLETLQVTENWLLVGIILLGGHLGGKLAGRVRLPAVVGYLIVGVILGTSFFDIMNPATVKGLGLISDFGLGIVAFLIGTELSRALIKRMGKKLIIILFAESFGAFFMVLGLVWVCASLTVSAGAFAIGIALIFAAMAPASAPAGTVAVIHEYKAKGPLTTLLLAIVGLDDALAIMIYAFAAAGAKLILGGKGISFQHLVSGPVIEIIGGITLGGIIGLALTTVSRCTKSRGELLTITIGAILLTTGLANAMHLSLILANLTVGMAMVNLSTREAERTYSAIKQITHPVYILFFVLAGAHLDLHILRKLSILAPVYITGRIVGKMSGAYFGTVVSKVEKTIRNNLGLGLMSQAGVAIGLALMVAREFGGPGSPYGANGRLIAALTINTIAATTIFFEIVGPITTKIGLEKAGEIGKSKEE